MKRSQMTPSVDGFEDASRSLNNAIRGYVEAAKLAEEVIDEEVEDEDDRYALWSPPVIALYEAARDISVFYLEAWELIEASGLDDVEVGHNLYLTRNGGPGLGFFGLDLGHVGDRLTEIARSYGQHILDTELHSEESLVSQEKRLRTAWTFRG